MRKIIALILCLAMLMAMTGCHKTDPDPTDPSQLPSNTDPNTPSNPPDSPAASSMIAVTMSPITEEFFSEDGASIARYSYPQFNISAKNSAVANAIGTDLLNRIEENRILATAMADRAEQKYDPHLIWEQYTLEVNYLPSRLDDRVISFSGEVITTEGDYIVATSCPSANYDAVTGQSIRLGDILQNESAAELLCDLILIRLQNMWEDLHSDYSSTVLSRFSPQAGDAWQSNEDWFFTDASLNICFAPDIVADSSIGAIIVDISYEDLQKILKPEYLPQDTAGQTGTLSAQPFKNVAQDSINRTVRLELDSEGETVALTVNGTIHNLRIDYGTLSYDGSTFFVYFTPLFCSSLSEGEMLRIQVALPEYEPTLFLSYTSGGEEVTCYLMTDEEGNILLMEELPSE